MSLSVLTLRPPGTLSQRLPRTEWPAALADTDDVSRYLDVISPDADALHSWIKEYRGLYEEFVDGQLRARTAL